MVEIERGMKLMKELVKSYVGDSSQETLGQAKQEFKWHMNVYFMAEVIA